MAEEQSASYEEDLAGYLQERIKPGLNSGAIPLLARSIAKEIAHRQAANGASSEPEASKDEGGGKSDEPEFEEEMHALQADLGEDWIVRFSVQGDDEWLTAEKADGSQRLEAPTASVLYDAVKVLEGGGGQSEE